jgi:hypothetical protein
MILPYFMVFTLCPLSKDYTAHLHYFSVDNLVNNYMGNFCNSSVTTVTPFYHLSVLSLLPSLSSCSFQFI